MLGVLEPPQMGLCRGLGAGGPRGPLGQVWEGGWVLVVLEPPQMGPCQGRVLEVLEPPGTGLCRGAGTHRARQCRSLGNRPPTRLQLPHGERTVCRSVDSESRGRTHQPSGCSSSMEGNPRGALRLAPQLWRVGVGGRAREPTCTRDRDAGSSGGNSPRGETSQAPRRVHVHTAWPPGPSAQQTLLGAWDSALCLGCRCPAIEVRTGEPRDRIRAYRGDPRAYALSACGQ